MGEDCQRFGIGFAPDSFTALVDELSQARVSIDRMVEAGLVIRPDDERENRKPWDRFRNRIMFPITDARGRLIAFGGRAMEKDAKAKYLNSPETAVFHKGQILYRYPHARKALHTPNNGARGLIVAEGYMDVIALARARDIKTSVASVYNTLNYFAAAGLLRRVTVEQGRAFFDTNLSAHHHFYFEDTGELCDIPGGDVTVTGISDLPEGTRISGVDVIVRLTSRQALSS